MRYFLPISLLILMLCGLLGLSACGGGSETGGIGTFIADIELEGEDYLADPFSPFEKMCMIFSQREAYALPNLGFDSNSYPFNQFSGDKDAQAGVTVIISAPDMTFIAQAETNSNGRVTFSDLPTGYLTLNITGQDGHTYHVPIQVSEDTTSRARILVRKSPSSGDVFVSSKTIHDEDGDGMNDDDFSYSLFNRPRDSAKGGRVHLHINNTTRIDANGDGDFNDPDDKDVIEPDDDGIPSSEGDGDEDNDGIPDNVDDNIDGDDWDNDDPNETDIDGDGLDNDVDDDPFGTESGDDFDAPLNCDDEPYAGITQLMQIGTENAVFVHFTEANDGDGLNEGIIYNIYYSTTEPIDFETAARMRHDPVADDPGDCDVQGTVINLIYGQTYYFSVRAQDSAQPPNETDNTNFMSVYIQLPD